MGLSVLENSGKTAYKDCIVHHAGGTDTGKIRSHNEDNFTILADCFFYCLADGVGGLAAGEIASANAIDSVVAQMVVKKKMRLHWLKHLFSRFIAKEHPAKLNLTKLIRRANTDVYQQVQHLHKRMATTMVALQLYDEQVIVGTVGDSRAYLVRKEIIGQISIDHTPVMELLLHGSLKAPLRADLNHHTITRALGSHSYVNPDIYTFTWQPGDLFLLCSDGLTDMLSDGMINAITAEHQANLVTMVCELIADANHRGGRDNITVIAVQIEV